MNTYIKKLISYLTLQVRDNSVNTIIGFLTSIDKEDCDWLYITNKLKFLELSILDFLEKDIDNVNSINKLKSYGIHFNNCYEFINEEFKLSFIKEAPFNNERVSNISNYKVYILARRTYLSE